MADNKLSFHDLNRLLENDRILIWGVGACGEQLKLYLDGRKKEGIYITDRNWEKISLAKNAIRTEDICKIEFDCVIIAAFEMTTAEDIKGWICQNGYADKIYWYGGIDTDEIVKKHNEDGYFNGNGYDIPLVGNEALEFMIKAITDDEPFLVSRWGFGEGDAFLKGKTDSWHWDKYMEMLQEHAGVFPNSNEVYWDFIREYESAAKEIDGLAVWDSYINMDSLFYNYTKQAQLLNPSALEPYGKGMNWGKKLRGKKVLVVHPFKDEIEKQYLKRTQIFENCEILPEFTLIAYKAIQSIGGNKEYKSWSEALEKMKVDIAEIDFDIALLGCGAYGMPLGAYIKTELRKTAIHIGGALQLLFGIKGGRWEGPPHYLEKTMYNDAWIRPFESSKPEGWKKVEGGCYW